MKDIGKTDYHMEEAYLSTKMVNIIVGNGNRTYPTATALINILIQQHSIRECGIAD
jgi:hypothetical protein